MDRIEATLRKTLWPRSTPTLTPSAYSQTAACFQGSKALPPSRIVQMLPYLKYRNVHGGNLYFRPSGESRLTLLDDLTPESLARLNAEGFVPSAVVETSPGNFQAWLKHAQPLPKELSTLAAKLLAARFGAD